MESKKILLQAIESKPLTFIKNYFDQSIKKGLSGSLHDISVSALRFTEAVCLAQLVLTKRPKSVLEIGMASGGSTTAIASALIEIGGEPHTALDPFQETTGGSSGLLELQRLGLPVRWLPENSESYLLKAGEYDFVFIDGGHTIGQKVTDAFLADKRLSSDGWIVFHDAFLESTLAAVQYLVKECGYKIIPLPADDDFKRAMRSVKYLSHGFWFASAVVPCTHMSLIALQKPQL